MSAFHKIEFEVEDFSETGREKLIDLYLFSTPRLIGKDKGDLMIDWPSPVLIAEVEVAVEVTINE